MLCLFSLFSLLITLPYKSVPFSVLTKLFENARVVIAASEIGTDSSSPKTNRSPARPVFFTLAAFSENETNVIQQETFHSKIFHPCSVKISVAGLEHVVAYARMCPCSITSHININYIHLQWTIKTNKQKNYDSCMKPLADTPSSLFCCRCSVHSLQWSVAGAIGSHKLCKPSASKKVIESIVY